MSIRANGAVGSWLLLENAYVTSARADIDLLIAEEEPESSEIEFKRTLPDTGSGSPDPWLSGGAIGDRARNALLAEVVAFANAYGGSLIIGIRESDDKPPRAAAVDAVPRCAELAERFRLQCRDCIEPQIPMLETIGIPTDEKGSGVVIVYVPRSLIGPHRSKPDLQCYVRRSDRSEKMSMREIRELTLQLDRGNAALDERFRRFASELSKQEDSHVAIRISSIPLAPLTLGRVFRNAAVRPAQLAFGVTVGAVAVREIAPPWRGGVAERPILRGARSTSSSHEARLRCIQDVYEDGVVEFKLFLTAQKQPAKLAMSWFMGLLANMLCTIELCRIAAGMRDVEYGMEVQILTNTSMTIIQYGGSHDDSVGPVFGPTTLP